MGDLAFSFPRAMYRLPAFSMRLLLLLLALAALPVTAQTDAHAGHAGHAAEGRAGAGHLAFEAVEHGFGSIREGAEAVHTFRFTNTGTEAVTLVEVRAACGCTTPTYTADPVAPGATGEIVVAYDSRGRPGPFDKTVTLAADGATPRVTTLRITGSVVADFATSGVAQGNLRFEAEAWDAGAVAPGEAVQHAFAFQNAGAAPVRVRAARATPGAGVVLTVPERPVFAGDVAAILVSVDDVSAVARSGGRFEVAVAVETTDPDQPVKSLVLRGRVATPRP